MDYESIMARLHPDAVAAIRSLESCGFKMFRNVRIEETGIGESGRRMTHTNAGRYQLMVGIKDIDSLTPSASNKKKRGRPKKVD